MAQSRLSQDMPQCHTDFLFLATLMGCGSAQGKDQTGTIAVSRAAAVTMPDPSPAVPQRNSHIFFNMGKMVQERMPLG